jgi:hypothetical protein
VKTKKVRVTNVPFNTYLECVVEIPEGTLADETQSAIRKAVQEGAYGRATLIPEFELDTGVLDKWEFNVK